ncbi:MAG: transporter suffix domain-containing protein [Bacteroidales bacterium]|nr:MAG: transporter suffix domain-containing protein [Bacteroidales bacterium]
MGNKSWKFKLGLILIILSCLLFLSLPLIPFLNLAGKTKLTVSTIVFIIAEVTFWSGGLLLGKELFTKYKSYLDPRNWFSKKVG